MMQADILSINAFYCFTLLLTLRGLHTDITKDPSPS